LIYFDTTYLVRLYFHDRGWDKVRTLAATNLIGSSAHGRAETVAALHRKLREGAISDAGFIMLMQQFEADCKADGFRWLPVSTAVIDRVVNAYSKLTSTIALRAADALHLACAAENGCREVYSNDIRLLAAATHFGLAGKDVI